MKKLIYLLTLVLITSCETEQLIKPAKYSLEEARKGFEKYLENNSSQLVSGKVNQEWFNIEKTIFWDKARPLKSETNFDGYIVPIWYGSAHRFGKQTIRALWAYENKETNEEVFHIVEIMATHEHMIKHHGNINLSDFTGIISIQDWHGGFMGGFEYKNGIKTGEVTDYIITDNVNHISERKAKNKDCGFQYSYVQNGEIVIVWYSQPCMTYWWIAYSQQLVSWAPQMWVDSQYGCEVTGGCVGETNSYYYEPVDIEQELRLDFENNKILMNQLKPCMQSIVTDLRFLNNGTVSQIIQKFSGTIPGYNWELKDGTLNGNSAQTGGYSFGKVTTIFDQTKFVDATDLSIARTILHEAIHAYLVTELRLDQVGSSKAYPELMKDYLELKFQGDANQIQHAEFVRSYVSDIAIALEEYGLRKGYQLNTQFYKDLAWGGLTHTGELDFFGNPVETTWFSNSFTETDRIRISNTIAIEQTGKDKYGATKTQIGKDAGC